MDHLASGGGGTDSSQVNNIDAQIKQNSAKMAEYAKYGSGDPKYHDEAKRQTYFKLQNKNRELKNKKNQILDKQRKETTVTAAQKYVNGFGEATHREITSLTYERAMKRQDKDIMSWLGNGKR